jgi:hypothetical protein
MPGQSRLECGGFNCKCRLTKTQRKPSANPPAKPRYFGRKQQKRNGLRWQLPAQMLKSSPHAAYF